MAAPTAEAFADSIDDAFGWRRMEIEAMRTEVERLNPEQLSRPFARMILRSSVALLYAHWEGFSKQVLQAYLDFVAKRRLTYGELDKPLLVTAVRHKFERMAVDPAFAADFVEDLLALSAKRAQLPKRGVVETGSNLRFDRLSSIFTSLGLDIAPFETRQHLIDTRLCDARNDIAHGGAVVPDPDSVLELIVIVLQMMGEVGTQLSNSIAQRSYRSDVA
ncbi:MAE_28990/MAE_18760 family HEPN-like nuclease [Curtobacterium sp. MEB011]|uniref:MAE_28990/MAE_18760 family HEPN-like nuclease n=1 Tax=Curtobacterium sp. MEB011 TaxID=3040285 RepID=UPI0025512955|nr:MAE_28990/MAE_18760 family HEPN-like nuclease [Curtobacterium sp. MEB011]